MTDQNFFDKLNNLLNDLPSERTEDQVDATDDESYFGYLDEFRKILAWNMNEWKAGKHAHIAMDPFEESINMLIGVYIADPEHDDINADALSLSYLALGRIAIEYMGAHPECQVTPYLQERMHAMLGKLHLFQQMESELPAKEMLVIIHDLALVADYFGYDRS